MLTNSWYLISNSKIGVNLCRSSTRCLYMFIYGLVYCLVTSLNCFSSQSVVEKLWLRSTFGFLSCRYIVGGMEIETRQYVDGMEIDKHANSCHVINWSRSVLKSFFSYCILPTADRVTVDMMHSWQYWIGNYWAR